MRLERADSMKMTASKVKEKELARNKKAEKDEDDLTSSVLHKKELDTSTKKVKPTALDFDLDQ
jgi:hypothetical protein